jgi:2-haloacid dehalogenase
MAKTGWKDLGDVKAISFGCFGTLIDWDSGLRRVFEEEGLLEALPVPFERFLELREEREAEWRELPYRHYREILAITVQETFRGLERKIDEQSANRIAGSIRGFDPYPDTISALRRLGSYWPLCILSNAERSTLGRLVEKLGIPFAELVSAEDLRSYKPAAPHFMEIQTRLQDRAEGLLHVGAFLERDVVPAHAAGISAAYLNRAGRRPSGVPQGTQVFPDLLELCEHLGV